MEMEAPPLGRKRKRDTKSILCLCVLTGAFLITFLQPLLEYTDLKHPEPQFTWNGNRFRPVGFNYYPSVNTWRKMWQYFNDTVIEKDILLLKSLGGNCLRTALTWDMIESGSIGNYNITTMEHLETLFDFAGTHNISIMLVFFDWGPPACYNNPGRDIWTNATLMQAQANLLTYVVSRLKDKPAAFMWDLINEPKDDVLTINQFAEWVGAMVNAIKGTGDLHYIVVGGGFGNFADPTPYASLVDAVCMHFYGQIYFYNLWKKDFETYLQLYKRAGKPIILQEFGLSTSGIYNQNDQAQFYKSILDLCDANNIAGIMPWCLLDFRTELTWTTDESHRFYGVIDWDYNWKPAAYVFRDYCLGQRQSSFNWDWQLLV